MACLRSVVNCLHDPEHGDLGLYAWPVLLDPGDSLTIEHGRRWDFDHSVDSRLF